MKKFTYVAVSVATAISLSGIGVALPQTANAALTSAQIDAIINLLQAFGADLDTIANVNATLTGSQIIIPLNSDRCEFSRNLTMGSRGSDVFCLQKYLNATGFTIATSGPGSRGNESTYFGNLTRDAVAKWQSTYSISPANGFFGLDSRSKYASIINNQPVPPTKQTISLIYPKDGYIWFLDDQNFEFKWTTSNFGSSNVFVYLQTNDGKYIPVATNVPDTGSYILPKLIPLSSSIIQTFPAGSYSAVVCGQFETGSGLSSVCSNTAIIKIQSRPQYLGQPTINIIYPNGGEVLQFGKEFEVRWSSQNLPTDNTQAILVGFQRSGSSRFTVGALTPNDGSEKILLSSNSAPNTGPGSDYKAIVFYFESPNDIKGNVYSDISDKPFSFQAEVDTTPSISITSPNGGEIWKSGSTQTIRWNSSNIGSTNIDIEVLIAGTGIHSNAAIYNIANTGQYQWTIPSDYPPGAYRLQIGTHDKGPSAYDTSDRPFSIY